MAMPVPQSHDPLRVIVLAGGDSAERQISLASGAFVVRALQAAGHHAWWVDPRRTPLESLDRAHFDCCFIALHGGPGEDGRMQQRLDRLGIPYTGSRPAGSQLAMSKSAAKQRFIAAGVPTPPYATFEVGAPVDQIAAAVAQLGYPLIIKPDAQGSSLGVSRLDAPGEFANAVREVSRLDSLAIAEPYIAGREFTVAVLDGVALPAIEIICTGELFSYDAKYRDDRTEHRFDTLPAVQAAGLEAIAVEATLALGVSGLSRVDILVDARERPWVIEINTSPGMTDRSLAPLAAARAGLPMPALCELLVERSLAQEVVR